MKDAYSLVHCKNIFADSSEYKENAYEQLTCPECFEPVFKKEKWVPLKKSETHFFSHYPGDINSCSRRSQNEVISSDSKDANKRMQSLLAFNKEFRNRIKLASHSILSKKNLSKMDSAYEYAERVSTAEINLVDLKKISKKIKSLLELPIFETIDDSLGELEDEITPIYLHLTGNYGVSNMAYLSAIVLMCTYQNSHSNIEDMLLKRTLGNHKNLDSALLGYSTLLLAEYVRAKKDHTKILAKFISKFESKDVASINKINSKKQIGFNPFIDLIESNDLKPNSSKKISPVTGSYHKCPHCLQSSYLNDDSLVRCPRCSSTFKTSPHGKSLHPNINIGKHKLTKETITVDGTSGKPNSVIVTYKTRVNPPTPQPSNFSFNKEALQQSHISTGSNHSGSKEKDWTKTSRGLQNKKTGDLVLFVDTLRDVFPISGYRVIRGSIGFINDSEIDNP